MKTQNQKQFWRIFLIEAGLFFIASLLSVLSAFQLNKLALAKEVILPQTSLQDFLVSFLIITFFVLFFVFYKKAKKLKGLIYKAFFIIACFWGGMAVLNLFLPVFGSILIMGVFIFLWLEFPTVWAHNILMALGVAGAASFLGLTVSSSGVIILLLVFSVYDFIAVYKTKHMVQMAKDMIDKKVIFGFVIPKELKYFKEGLNKVKPGGNFMILGGGDVVFPALLAVSVIPQGFLKALVIIAFSLFGSFLAYWIFTRGKEPIPALPPIAFSAIFGYLLTLLF